MQNLLGNSKTRSSQLPMIAVVAVLVILVIAIRRPSFNFKLPGGTQFAAESLTASADGTGWTAVYLDNDQVFYGQVVTGRGSWVVLTNVFTYNPSGQPAGRKTIRVTKVGTELHQPLDRVHLNREHVVMTQALPGESKVVKAIEAYQPEGEK